MKKALLVIFALFVVGCTIYTESQSEVLSQSVYATAEGIKNGRIDFAYKTAEMAKRIVIPPKYPLVVPPLITSNSTKIKSVNTSTPVKQPNNSGNITTNVITTTNNGEQEKILRLVIPEFLKDAKLLIENSEEWNELLKTKEFNVFLENDNKNLKNLNEKISEELRKQKEYSNLMVIKINELEKEAEKKNNIILKQAIAIVALIAAIAGGIYLRIKGIL